MDKTELLHNTIKGYLWECIWDDLASDLELTPDQTIEIVNKFPSYLTRRAHNRLETAYNDNWDHEVIIQMICVLFDQNIDEILNDLGINN